MTSTQRPVEVPTSAPVTRGSIPVPLPTSELPTARRAWTTAFGVLGAIIGVALGAAIEPHLPRSYTATTSILVVPTGSETILDPENSATVGAATEAIVLTSDQVLQRAADATGQSLETLRQHVSSADVTNSTVLNVAATADSPELAQATAAAVSDAYISLRHSTATRSIANFITRASAHIDDELIPQITRLTNRLDDLTATSVARASVQARLNTLNAELEALSGRVAIAQARSVTDPQVLRRAELPTTQDFPPTSLIVPALGVLNAIGGVCVLWLLRRWHAEPF